MSEIDIRNLPSSARSKGSISEHELRNLQSRFLVCWKALVSNTQESSILDMRKPFFLFLLLLPVVLAGCGSQGKVEPTITTLAPAEFAKIISNDDVFVIDTHIPEQEHIKGTNAFIAYDTLLQNKDKLPSDKNTPVAVYCRSGSMSAEATKTLQQMGYTRIYDLAGGTNAWRENGFEFGQIEKYDGKITGNAVANSELKGPEVTVYKSASCGCCNAYLGYLENQGYAVKTVVMEDLTPIKRQYGISPSMESCHTTIMGDYFIEGHIPIEAVRKLLDEKPDIKGIALPGMPYASPGMPGSKKGPFRIYAIGKDGQASLFMSI